MTDEPPEPPANLPTSVADGLGGSSPTELLAAVRYAEALAEYRRGNPPEGDDATSSGATPESSPDQGQTTGADNTKREGGVHDGAEEDSDARADSEERPNDVPSNASVTIKTINGNRYRYWQWRDGEKIRSKYIEPVGTGE